ncbi:MAG: NHLP bacteriocin export ABC transporter permease/ATPase subunit, partial [Alphaproteobacteria bacterium]|nr:NHLP bacteriocin export ABC transporter permease/ATPase subunit [Alphaproteobacteria bacterium]
MNNATPSKIGLPALLGITGDGTPHRAGAQIPLQNPDDVWFVGEGSLEIFMVHRKDGVQVGAREYLCSIDRGGLAWGVPVEDPDNGLSLVALAVGDVVLVRIDAGQLAAASGSPALVSALTGPLDAWIAGLSQGVTRHITPRSAPKQWITAGNGVTLAATERASSHKGIVWVLLKDGGGRFIDICDVASPNGSTMVPLSQHTWLRENGVRTLQGYSTANVLKVAGWDKRLAAFHDWIMRSLAYNLRNARNAENKRLEERSSETATETERILSRLVTLLDERQVFRPTIKAEDALFECCSLVGKKLGLTLTPPPSALRKRTEDPNLTVEDIVRYSQLRSRQVALRGPWWTEDNGPMVGHYEEDMRPVALLPVKGGTYVANDPVSGSIVPVTEAVAALLSPVAHTFYPPLPERRLSAVDLISFGLKRSRGDVAVILLSGAIAGLLGAAVPVATGYLFDSVIPGHQQLQLAQVGLALVTAAFATAVFRLTSDIAQLRLEGRIAGVLQASIVDRMLRLPNAFFASYSAGDLASRVLVIESVRKALTGVVLGSLLSGVFSVFSFALLFYYEPVAALIATVLLVLLMSVTFAVGIGQTKAIMEGEAMSGNLNSLVLQIVTGITKLRLAGAEDRAFNFWGANFSEMRARMVKSRGISNLFQIFYSGYEVLCMAAVFAVIALMADEDMTTGVFLAFVGAFTTFLAAASQMSRSIIMVYSIIPMYGRAKPLLEATPENSGKQSDPGHLTGEFEINQAAFRYSRDTSRVLNGVSIKGAPGEFIAVVGPSGSGKSTLMKLLLGFERPESGAVLFDGQDIKGLDLQALRRQIGVVLQSGRLMPGTIYENIKGASHATVEDAWEAARMTGLAVDIKAMPMGMHTVLTEGSAALSGGQIQRILLARAVVGKPRILLLDEATSALDNRTQAVVTESLDRLSVTRVVIAHRLTTIMRADRIYVL